jgi:hypothetical protein
VERGGAGWIRRITRSSVCHEIYLIRLNPGCEEERKKVNAFETGRTNIKLAGVSCVVEAQHSFLKSA